MTVFCNVSYEGIFEYLQYMCLALEIRKYNFNNIHKYDWYGIIEQKRTCMYINK